MDAWTDKVTNCRIQEQIRCVHQIRFHIQFKAVVEPELAADDTQSFSTIAKYELQRITCHAKKYGRKSRSTQMWPSVAGNQCTISFQAVGSPSLAIHWSPPCWSPVPGFCHQPTSGAWLTGTGSGSPLPYCHFQHLAAPSTRGTIASWLAGAFKMNYRKLGNNCQ